MPASLQGGGFIILFDTAEPYAVIKLKWFSYSLSHIVVKEILLWMAKLNRGKTIFSY